VPRRRAIAAYVAVGGGVGLVVASVGPASTGCTTHQCDQSSYDWWPTPDGRPGPGGGFMVDETTYVSNGLDQTWLDYHGNTTVRIWFPPSVAGWIAEAPQVLTGTDDMPNSDAALDSGANYTQVLGQIATFNTLNTIGGVVDGHTVGGQVLITNSSCASYFAQITVHFIPTGPIEAGGAAQTAPGAGADAGIDSAD
jgi:hypothetical protein